MISRLLLRLPPALAGLTARASSPLARHTLPGLPLRHLGAPKTTSSRPLPVSVSWKMRSRTMPGPAGPSRHTACAPVRVLMTTTSPPGPPDGTVTASVDPSAEAARLPVAEASTPPRTRW